MFLSCTSITSSPEVKPHDHVLFLHTSNASPSLSPDLPSVCLGSTVIFFRRFSMPLRSVIPYSKAIFSYSLGWALLSNSHTSIGGSSFSGFFFLLSKEKGKLIFLYDGLEKHCWIFFNGNNQTSA